jgi:hypothetical protein
LAERPASDGGAVTAELAVAMPAVTVVLAAVLALTQTVLAQVTCVDAARTAARAAARGDDLAAVRQIALDAAGGSSGAREAAVAVGVSGDAVTVSVTRPVRLVALGPVVQVSARSVAQREQAVTGVGP